jgi:hypothetical protein
MDNTRNIEAYMGGRHQKGSETDWMEGGCGVDLVGLWGETGGTFL